MMEKKTIPANAGKLLNAVASIGYDTEVALCDLIDNSLDANARAVHLYIEELVEAGESTDIISRYIISDDGTGMEEEALENAFTLGSDRDYGEGSLGKFGLGLKSAGLSLGGKITIITKTDAMEDPLCAILSLADVEETGNYQISIGKADNEPFGMWDRYQQDGLHGTLLIIDELNGGQSTARKFVDYVTRYCSQVYHMAIEDSEKPLNLFINQNQVEPVDPLFVKQATENGSLFNINGWDGKKVHLLIEDTELTLGDSVVCTIAATNLVHPPTFEIEGGTSAAESARKKYQVDTDPYTRKPRHGFYIYRNRRIIVMAERFHGLVSSATQSWSFRARLMFDQSADDILALDVKKRHMKLPKSARSNLKNLISTYQTKSINAWKLKGATYKKWKGVKGRDVAEESISKTPVGDLNYAPNSHITTEDDLKKREELQEKISKKTIDSIQDKTVNEKDLEEAARNKLSIVFVDGMRGNAMWEPYPAVKLGRAETILNKQQSWIAEALQAIDGNPTAAIILYQLVAIISRAELEVRSTPWPNIPSKSVDKVFDMFRKKAGAIGEDVADSLNEEILKIINGGMQEE